MHKSQVFAYLLISFLVGVFVSAWFANVTVATLIFILIGTMVVVVCGYEKTFVKTKKAERNRRVGITIGACVLALALGIFRYGQADLNSSVLLQFADVQAGGKGVQVELKGYVDNFVTGQSATTGKPTGQLILHVVELDVPQNSIKVDERTLIFTGAFPEYKIGDRLSVLGALQKATNFTPDFDYVEYLKNKEIRTTVPYPRISFDSTVSIPLVQQAKIALYKRLFDIRDRFQFAVGNSLPETYAAYTNGILLGTRQNIPPALTDAFNKTSTTHILAISGYNITIIAEALLGVLVFAMRRRRAFWVSVVVIILFTIMTGAGASVVRAAIMGLLLLSANGYGRWYDPRNSILCAATVMVFLDPLSLRFDVGFQLSFLAVLGLLYIYPILEDKFKKIPEWIGLKETLLMSCAAQIAVAPLLAYTFHTFSLVSLPANILVLPLMPYTMLFGFLTGIAGLIAGPLGRAVGVVSWVLSSYQIHVIKWFGSLSFSAVTVAMSTAILFLIYALIVFGIWSFKKLDEPRT